MNEVNKMKEIMTEKGFALLLSAILLISMMPAIASASDWPQFQVNETNIGRTDDSAPTKYWNETVLWRTYTSSTGWAGIDVAPLVVGDLVYVVAANNSVWAFNKTTGAKEWKSDSSGSGFIVGNPAYGNNTIFVPTKDGKIYAFNATTGVKRWDKEVCADKQLNTPVTYHDHKIFFGDWDGPQKYYCYHDNGTQYWNRCSGEHIYNFKTGAGTDKWAYGKQVSQTPMPPSTNNDPNNVFTTAQYTNISADDQTFQNDTADTNYHAAHRFNFSIDESASITKISVTWNGIGTRSNNNHGATLYIWNFSSAEYDQLGSTTSDQEVTLTGENASAASNYISSSGNVTVLVVQKYYSGRSSTQKSQIKTDYVRVRVCPSGKGYYWAGAAVIGNYLVYGDDNDNLTSVEWNNVTIGAVWTADELNLSSLPGADTNARHIRSSIAWNATNATYGHIFFTDRRAGSSGSSFLWKIGFNKSTGKFQRSDNQSRNIKYSTSTPAIYKGRVYVGGGNFSTGVSILLCANESDINHTAFWEFTPNGAVQSSPALSIQGSDVYIYFTTNANNGTVYCLKGGGSSCEEKWKYTTEEARGSRGYILQGVAISDGWVYFGNDGGYLYGTNRTDRIHVYDFNDGAGTNKWAFRYQNNSKPPITCDVPSTEFSSTEYGKIKRKYDNMIQKDTTNTPGYYAAHRFNFSIDETTSDITALNVSWNGKGYHDSGGNDNGAYLYIYNFTSGGYGSAVASTDNSAEVTLIWGNASSASNYINSGNVTILVEQNSQDDGSNHSHIWTDYVKLLVHTKP